MGNRLPRGSHLTTAEAAAVLKVSVATLKRWTQSGLLPSDRTEGGHRRFRAEDVQALAAPLVRPDDPALLGADQVLHATGPLGLQAWLLEARRSLGSWWAVSQPLRAVMLELYRRRDAGALGAIQLEVAVDRLRGAMLRLAEPQVPAQGARLALVAAVPGDPFLLIPALLQLSLPESGWTAEWAGHPQVDDLLAEVRARAVEAVIVTVSRAVEPEAVERFAGRLEAAAGGLGVPVAVIGLGAWPPAPGAVARLGSTEAAAGWLAGLERGAPAGAALLDGLAWDEALAIGDEVVDAQHRTLFEHTRRFLGAVERGDVPDGGRELLAFIADYARLHFGVEEELLRNTGYPSLAEHLREHELFGLQLTALARDVEGDARPGALRRLARFLATWLREHVSGSDQRIGQHLRAIGWGAHVAGARPASPPSRPRGGGRPA